MIVARNASLIALLRCRDKAWSRERARKRLRKRRVLLSEACEEKQSREREGGDRGQKCEPDREVDVLLQGGVQRRGKIDEDHKAALVENRRRRRGRVVNKTSAKCRARNSKTPLTSWRTSMGAYLSRQTV